MLQIMCRFRLLLPVCFCVRRVGKKLTPTHGRLKHSNFYVYRTISLEIKMERYVLRMSTKDRRNCLRLFGCGQSIFGEQECPRLQWTCRCRECISVVVFVELTRYKSCAAVWGIRVTFITHSPTRSNQYVIRDFLHFGNGVGLPNFATQVVELILNSVPD